MLLQSLAINQVTVIGDTRFDRVVENALHPKSFDLIKSFCGNKHVLIAGSTWPADEKLLVELAREQSEWKFIIAPHEISENKIVHLEKQLSEINAIRYSVLTNQVSGLSTQYSVLIIDNSGMLSSLYQYGQIAYIGGGFGSGIHNILEAAAFGLPVLFGPNHHKFQEAKDMIELGAAFPINNLIELETAFNKLNDESNWLKCGRVADKYVKNRAGATREIVKQLLLKS